MYYAFYEWNHALLTPARIANDAVRLYYKNPLNPLTHTEFGRQIAAAGDLFERMTRRYGKPEFGIDTTISDGIEVEVEEHIEWARPFCRLVHFRKNRPAGAKKQPALVIVAPMSGHYATLLRGTVAALLPQNDVYITDWIDARMVPAAMGTFDLDDYIDYVDQIVDHFDGACHLVAVCQPAVPVFAATALMETRGRRHPRSITLMGGPIDTNHNPTEVNRYAASRDIEWFQRNVIMTVPFPYPAVGRRVYPGFLQLTGFMTMNLDRHMSAHYDYFDHLVSGDGDSAEKHRDFYDEYLSVMDLTAEFYLQTVDTVFIRQALPNGTMTHRGRKVDPGDIRATPILTVEGEKDDISGIGQTRAAHRLTPNLPAERHEHYEQAGVGHYGVFNGSRFRREIAPRISAFVAHWDDPNAVGRAFTPSEEPAENAQAPEAEAMTLTMVDEALDTLAPAAPRAVSGDALATPEMSDDAADDAGTPDDAGPSEDAAADTLETATDDPARSDPGLTLQETTATRH